MIAAIMTRIIVVPFESFLLVVARRARDEAGAGVCGVLVGAASGDEAGDRALSEELVFDRERRGASNRLVRLGAEATSRSRARPRAAKAG